jgi:hypothetical protein
MKCRFALRRPDTPAADREQGRPAAVASSAARRPARRGEHVERCQREPALQRSIAGSSEVTISSYRLRSRANARSCADSALSSNVLSSGVM